MLLIFVVVAISGMLVYVKLFDNNQINQNDNQNQNQTNLNLPKCNDGIDNDQDGLTDYGPEGDPDCDSPFDDSEKNYDLYYFIVFLVAIGLLGYVIVKLVNSAGGGDKKKQQEDSILLPPITPDRAYELCISGFLKQYPDSERIVTMENNGLFKKPYLKYSPFYEDDIQIHYKTPDQHPTTGEEFMLFFIEVKRGPPEMVGHRLLWCSLRRGEDWIKGGGWREEKGTHWWNFDKKIRTFRMSTAPNKQDAMLMYAIENSDDDSEIRRLIGRRQFHSEENDMTDDEFREMKRQQIWAQKRSGKKKKSSAGGTSQQAYGNFGAGFDDDDDNADWGGS